jgi:glycosyltransferase involved in cell wall biosynthesis
MKITIVIVTRNRAKYVAGALLALSQLDYSMEDFEVIVADNGSTDSTADVTSAYEKLFPNFRYFFDPRPGQIVGWHMALLLAKGEVVCFIDDDTRPAPNWLNATAEAFSDSSVGLVTGPITPKFETPIPNWRRDMVLTFKGGVWSPHIGLLDLGKQVKEIPAAFVWGRNFLVRRVSMLKAGGFHPGGFPAHLFLFTGDGDMGAGKTIEANGHKVLYHPGCAVVNLFQAHQNNPAEIERWIYGEGIVTSYILLRQAATHASTAEECQQIVSDQITEDMLDNIGKGYLSSFKNLPDTVKNIFSTAGREGFGAHQNYFKTDSNFRDWVLRTNYLDIEACYSHPDLKIAKS